MPQIPQNPTRGQLLIIKNLLAALSLHSNLAIIEYVGREGKATLQKLQHAYHEDFVKQEDIEALLRWGVLMKIADETAIFSPSYALNPSMPDLVRALIHAIWPQMALKVFQANVQEGGAIPPC